MLIQTLESSRLLHPVRDLALSEFGKSWCFKVVTVSALGCYSNYIENGSSKTCNIKMIYMVLVLMKRWGQAAGCRDCEKPCRLWMDLSEGTEEMVIGRRFHSETARRKKE